MDSINISKEALPYILYQRTGYLKHNPFFRAVTLLGERGVFPRLGISLRTTLFADAVRREFISDMEAEYESIKPFLPAQAEALLDIGCGIGGLEILLSHHYNRNLEIYLLDKTAIDPSIHYGFESQASFYSSLELAKELLTANGVPSEKIHLQEANDSYSIDFSKSFDVIISLLAWGFHFPISTYLPAVYKSLKPGGVLIVDVRLDTDGLKALEEKFSSMIEISRAKKHVRICLTK